MRNDLPLYEKLFEELSRVCTVLHEELTDVSDALRYEKLEERFSLFTTEEIIGLYETLELF